MEIDLSGLCVILMKRFELKNLNIVAGFEGGNRGGYGECVWKNGGKVRL